MMRAMDNLTKSQAVEEQERRRHARRQGLERAAQALFASLAEQAVGVGVFVFKCLLDINGKVEQMEEQVQQLEATLNEVEAKESTIVAGVTEAGERFAELAKTIEGLQGSSTGITPEEIETLNAQAQGVLAGLTTAAEALNAEIPAASGGTSGGGTAPAVPTKTQYIRTGEADLGTTYTVSTFQVPLTPANPTTGAAEEPAKPLYEFSGDAEGTTEQNGVVEGAWSVYEGNVEAVPAAS